MKARPASPATATLAGAACLALALAGCAEGGPVADPTSWGPTEWSLEEEWRLGGHSETRLDLSYVLEAVPAPGGGLSFSQLNTTAIITLNADGSIRHAVGRQGGGPGEWVGIPRIAWREDELKVVAGSRVHTFGERGEHIETALVRPPLDLSFASPPRAVMELKGGGVLGLGRSLHPDAGRPRPDVLVHWEPDGRGADSITTVHGPGFAVSVSLPPRGMTARRPFPWDNHFAFSPDGSRFVTVEADDVARAEGDSAMFQVRIYEDDRQLGSEFTVDYVTRRVSDAGWADTIAGRRANLEDLWGAPAAAIESALREAFGPPPVIHPATAIVISTDGDLWIDRGDLAEPASRVWEVRDEDGALSGVLRMRNDDRLVAVDGPIAWAVLTDEFDVPILVRNRLVLEPRRE